MYVRAMPGFSAQVIALYTATLGEWSRPLIGGCAFLVMFSTTLAVVDGFPRALAVLTLRARRPELPWGGEESGRADPDQDTIGGFKAAYWISLVVLAGGAEMLFMLRQSTFGFHRHRFDREAMPFFINASRNRHSTQMQLI